MADNNNEKKVLGPVEGTKNLAESTPAPSIPSSDKAMKGITGRPTLRNVIDVMQYNADKKEEAMQRKHKREQIINSIADGVSSLANLYFASKGAPSVQQTSLTEAAQKRYDKLAEDRRKKQAEMMDLYTKAYLADQQQANVDREYNRQVARDEADDAYRNSRAKVADSQWRQSFERQMHRDNVGDSQWKQEFDHKQQQANVENSLRRQGLAIQQQEFNQRQREYNDRNTYYLKTNKGMVSIPASKLNPQTVSTIYSMIPEDDRKKHLKPIYGDGIGYDGKQRQVVGYETPSIDDMMNLIGQYANDDEISNAIHNLAGVNPPTPPKSGASQQGSNGSTPQQGKKNRQGKPARSIKIQ